MDLFLLLDELRTIARNGLHYATNPYDQERYERLLTLASEYYGAALDLPPENLRQQFQNELGHITPKIGGDAAIFDAEGRILLMQRADNGRWCLPCGWVEPNESPADCAVRETREETGLEVEIQQLVGVFPRMANIGYGPHSMVAIVYLCKVVGGALTLSHEGLDLRYWHIDNMTGWHAIHESLARAAYAVWKTG